MKKEYVIEGVLPALGQLNAMLKNVMAKMQIDDPNEAIRRINSGEWTVIARIRQWTEENGVISFNVISDGLTGPERIVRLESKGFRVGDAARFILNSTQYQPTKAGTVHRVKVLKGELFSDSERSTEDIRAEAGKRNLTELTAEVAGLIRENFSDDELTYMGLGAIVVMHEPIKDSDDVLRFLGACSHDGGRWLFSYYYHTNACYKWRRGFGFAFGAEQVVS